MCKFDRPCKFETKGCEYGPHECYPLCEGYEAGEGPLYDFGDLLLGTRFRYPTSDTVWVKLDEDGNIAQWDERRKTSGAFQILGHHEEGEKVEVL